LRVRPSDDHHPARAKNLARRHRGHTASTGSSEYFDWFSDAHLIEQLPRLHHVLAAYCRVVRRLGAAGRIPGQRRIWEAIGRVYGLVGRSVILVEVRGTPVAIDLIDPRVMHVLREASGTDEVGRALVHLLGNGDCFLDVGANHAAYAAFASSLVGTTGRVLAFEPQPDLAVLIRRTYGALRRDPADVHEVACTDRETRLTLAVPPGMSGSASLYGAADGTRSPRTVAVYARRIDDVVRGVDLPGRVVMKLDVEGAELVAIRGARALLKDRGTSIVLEVNPSTSARAGYGLGELADELHALGYRSSCEIDDLHTRLPLVTITRGPQRNVVVVHDRPTRSDG